MAIDVVMLLDPEAVYQTQGDEVQLPVRQEGASAHAVADAVCEDLRVGLLEPALRAEDFRVRPDFRIYTSD